MDFGTFRRAGPEPYPPRSTTETNQTCWDKDISSPKVHIKKNKEA